MPTNDPSSNGYELVQDALSPNEDYQVPQISSNPPEAPQILEVNDAYPTEGYQSPSINAYPTEGYRQSDSSNAYQIPENYPQSPASRSPEIVSYVAVIEADRRKIISANLSEKLVSNDPSYKLLQGHYLNDRRVELEEQSERIEAKQTIQDKLAANRAEHGHTHPAQNREREIER